MTALPTFLPRAERRRLAEWLSHHGLALLPIRPSTEQQAEGALALMEMLQVNSTATDGTDVGGEKMEDVMRKVARAVWFRMAELEKRQP